MNQRRIALFFAILGNAIFGLSFMFSRVALRTASPFVMLMYRFDLTFLLMLGIAWWASRRRKPSAEGQIDWLRFDLKGRSLLPLAGLGMLQPVSYFLFESYGISMTNSTLSSVLISLIPLAGMAFSAFLLREAPKPKQIVFALLSIAGIVLMTLQQSAEGGIEPLGILLLVGAVISGALFYIVSRHISATYSVLERTVVMMGTAAIAFTVLALVSVGTDMEQLAAPLRDPGFLPAIGYLSICSSVIAFMALNYCNNFLPVTVTTAFANLTTVISVAAGALFLHEPFNVMTVVAAAMIIAGVWGVQKSA